MAELSPRWEWGDRYDRYEAILGRDVISWIWTGPKDLGGAADQPIAEFLAFGPLDTDAPAHVLTELRATIEARDKRDGSKLQADADALRSDRLKKKRESREAEDAAIERSRAARALPDPWREYGKPTPVQDAQTPAAPLWPLLGRGLLVFAISTASSLALATVQPLLANYLGLFLPVLLGFGAAARWGSISLIVGGLFAMAGGIGSLIAYDRYLELSRGSVATLGSIA